MKKFFLTVKTFSNTTKLGIEISKYIFGKYDRVIVSDVQLYKITNEIDDLMQDLRYRNKRLKPMKIGVSGFIRGLSPDCECNKISDNPMIWIYSSMTGDNDNRPFSICATKIKNDFTMEKGGDK